MTDIPLISKFEIRKLKVLVRVVCIDRLTG